MKIYQIFVVFLTAIFAFNFFNVNVFADVLINGFYPAPLTGEKEWVEFYNNSSDSADLSNYFFDDDNDFSFDNEIGGKIINLKGVLPPMDRCYWELVNYLNNDKDTPTLFDQNGNIIDSYSYKNPLLGKVYRRIPDGGVWQENIDATRSAVNCFDLVPSSLPTPSATVVPTSTPTLTPIFSPTPTPVSYSSLYLSEVMVNPLIGEKEWVEIYNNNDFEVFLDGWYVDDTENAGATPKKFSLTVGPKGYGVIEFSSAIFNNDGDQVRLLDFNKSEKDSFEYNQSLVGKSWGRADFNSDSWCLQEPTKGQTNRSCLTNNTNTNNKSTVTLIPSPTATNNTFPKTNFSQAKTIKKRTAKKIEDYIIRDNNYFLSSQKGEVLGEEIENKTKKPREIFLLPLIYSLTSTILSLKKILEQLPT